MRARLGFSVATIVEPDILILDEVLSVGDAKFRKKCENRIQSMFDKGVTVIFVSHSTSQVLRMCNKGILLEQGIGDTMRISLTDDPTEEVRACWTLLSALGLRRRDPELVSCPTCGRCQVDLIPIAQEVEKRLRDVHRPIQVAVMGCVVNGPGEAADADIGVACGKGSGVVFAHGKTLRKVEEAAIVDVLMEEIGNL